MFDPKCMLSITINGQLMLLMLCEWLMDIGVRIDMCNTDGVTIMYDKSLHDQVEAISKRWEEVTRMELEAVPYTKVVRRDINNYLALYTEKDKDTGEMKVKAKEKGMFMTDPEIDKSRDFLVIAKALKAHYMEGTDISYFIKHHTDIYDFCAAQKVDKKYTVYWNGVPQQRLNRYYISRSGPYLYKSKDGKGMEHMMKGWSVELFNDYVEKEDYNINFEYYIAETKKVMNELSSQQMKMFQ